MPRYLENPTERVEDIRSAVDYLTTLPQIDAEKIGVVGICAGGGYALSAAQTEQRIKVMATASAVDIGMTFRQDWDGKGTVADQLNTLNAVAKERTAEANGTEPIYTQYVPEQNEITADTERDMREASDYYRTPQEQHPNAKNNVSCPSLAADFKISPASAKEARLRYTALRLIADASDRFSRACMSLAEKEASG